MQQPIAAPAPSAPTDDHAPAPAAATAPLPVDSTALSALAAALDTMSSQELLVEVVEGVETLLVYATNLLKHHAEPRFHVVSAVNVHFQARLGHLAGSDAAMRALGYRRDGAAYVAAPAALRPEAVATRTALVELLAKRRGELEDAFRKLPARPPLPAHQFSAVTGVGVASDCGQRQLMEDDDIVLDNFQVRSRKRPCDQRLIPDAFMQLSPDLSNFRFA